MLSNSQSYVKSFDGMAYELQGKLKEGASTADIKAVSDAGGRSADLERIVPIPPPLSSLTCRGEPCSLSRRFAFEENDNSEILQESQHGSSLLPNVVVKDVCRHT